MSTRPPVGFDALNPMGRLMGGARRPAAPLRAHTPVAAQMPPTATPAEAPKPTAAPVVETPPTVAPTPEPRKLTVLEKILVAAASLPREPFTQEHLVVTCWEQFGEAFALRGYPQHPDSVRVYPKLTINADLITKGLIRRHEDSTFTVTPVGRAWAKTLRGAQ